MQVQVAMSIAQADTKGEKEWGDQNQLGKLPRGRSDDSKS